MRIECINSPVAANVLPRGYSHIPAKSCASPPLARDMPTTTLGVVMPRACTLYMDRINVVDAKEKTPLSRCKHDTRR